MHKTVWRGLPFAPISPIFEELQSRYGSDAQKILDYGLQDKSKLQNIISGLPFVWAELDYLVAHEFVRKIADVLQRRWMVMFYLPCRRVSLAKLIAPYLGKLLNWDELCVNHELSEYQLLYETKIYH